MRTQGTPPRQAYNAQTSRERAAGHPRRGDHDRRAGLRASGADARHHPAAPRQARCERAARGGRSADAGYWHTRQIQAIDERGIEVLVPPDGTMRDGIRPGWEHGFFDVMRQQARHRPRPTALREAQDHRRTGLRADQTQPAHRPVHAKRQGRRAVRMAVSERDAQSAQAPQPLDRQHRLTHGRAGQSRGSAEPPRGHRIPLVPNIPTASRRSSHATSPSPPGSICP